MTNVDIEKLLKGPEPHPFRKIFTKYKVSQHKLAYYLGVPQQSVSRWLSGYTQMPEEMEEEMKKIIIELEKRSKS